MMYSFSDFLLGVKRQSISEHERIHAYGLAGTNGL